MHRLIVTTLLALATLICFGQSADVVTTVPAVVTTDSAPVTITFHADRGSRGLAGLGASTPVYAHTGVILRGHPGEWQHASSWLDNSARYRMTYAGTDTWNLTLPSIAEYYGLTAAEAAEVEKLMFVFRNATGSREGKTASGGDIAVEVSPAGLSLRLGVSTGSAVISSSAPATVEARASQPCRITLTVTGPGGTSASTVSADGATTLSLPYTFADAGNYTASATASAPSGATATATLPLLRIAPTSTEPYPLGEVRQGMVRTGADGRAIFTLAAPGKSNVVLLGSWNGFAPTISQQMKRADTLLDLPADTSYIKNAWSLRQPYFWTAVEGLDPSATYTYYYLVDGITAVADPYSTLVLDPASDRFIPSGVFPSMPEYPAAEVPDGTILSVITPRADSRPAQLASGRPALDDLVVYELLIRDFTGTGDADGTIAGVIDRLDYIRDLGVNAIELLPVMEFGGNNSWGYNPLFYFAPDKAYGTPADYRRLVDEIHSRGMAVIFDVVMNHADTRNPRQLMYAPAQNPFFNATPPHSYNAFHDWNQDNPLVFSQWVDVLRYWIEEYGADGFRFDLVKGMGDNGSYGIAWDRATNSFAAPSETTTNRYNPSRVARMERLKKAIDSIAPLTYFICEDLAGAEEDRGLAAAGAIDWANINYAACQWAMGWSSGADLARFYSVSDGRPYGATLSYAESHDEERAAYKQQQWGVASVKGSPEVMMRRLGSVAAMMIMTPGPHMIWQFEELGDAQPVKKADGNNNTDPRRPAWDLLADPANASLHQTYTDLLAIRRAHPDLFTSSSLKSIAATASSWSSGYTLSLESPSGKRLILAANPLTDRDLAVATGADASFAVGLSSPGLAVPAIGADGSVTLAPGAFAILVNSAAGVTDVTTDSGSALPAATYDMAGRRVDNASPLSPGIYIRVDAAGRATRQLVR